MGERLYATGYKFGANGSKFECLGKGFYYFDNERSLASQFIQGLVAGFNLGKVVKDHSLESACSMDIKKLQKLDKDILDNMESVQGWEFNGGWECDIKITKSVMYKIFELYAEDKKREDIWPYNDEGTERLKKFIEEYDYFVIEHGG